MTAYFIGIDIGTQGARVVILDCEGQITASSERNFGLDEQSREEQSPQMWWEACKECLLELSTSVADQNISANIIAMGVSSTSGTVIPLDQFHQPLHNAIMYSDKRSAPQGEKCTAIAIKNKIEGFTGFNSSSGLAKMVWFNETYPEKAKKLDKWIHAADYITGILSGQWGITDYTNALKSGYDVNYLEWPEFITTDLSISKNCLPKVVPSGSVIGAIDPAIATMLHLPNSMKVITGITDGCASQIASGAIKPGDWNTTIGTTMVIKGVTIKQLIDDQGRIYSHRHPAGYWMPGGASNTGADWVTNEFGKDLTHLSTIAATLIPTGHFSYPLRQKGERFPMVAPGAIGFEPAGLSIGEKFTANMEGVAYLERYAFELIKALSNEDIKVVYTAGGGSNNEVWLKIRSNVLNLPIIKMKHVSGAVGAAILAASNTYFTSLIQAVEKLTRIEKEVRPEIELANQYNKNYQQFISLLIKKGYINETIDA
jgi:sugar (pentulose or hexulose) kinase